MKKSARFLRFAFIGFVVASLLSLSCVTLTLSTNVVSSPEPSIERDGTLWKPISLGLNLDIDFDADVLSALNDIYPNATQEMVDNMRARWTVETSDNGRIIHASRPLAEINSSPAEWKIEWQPVVSDPENSASEPGRIVTATLQIDQVLGEQESDQLAIRSLYVVTDESLPGAPKYLYHAEIFVPEEKEPEPKPDGPSSPWSGLIVEMLQPETDKLNALDAAIQKAGSPEMTITADLPIPIKSATMNGEIGGEISEENKNHVQWTVDLETPGTYILEAVAEQRLPVIFLPGVAGTVLQSNGYEVWPLAPFGDRRDMAFLEDGVTPATEATVTPADILRDTTLSALDFYGEPIKQLKEMGYVEGIDLAVFPYDWRQSNDLHFGALDQLVDKLRDASGQDKVVLMGHSMGGVIAKGYIYSSAEHAAKVDTLITLATPQWGSPKVFYAMINGYKFGNPFVRQPLMKILVQNMPAAYQLMPQVPFIWDVPNSRVLSLDESHTIRYKGIAEIDEDLNGDDYTETEDNVMSLNPALLERAEQYYAPIGTKSDPRPLPNGVKYYAIIGYGVNTLSSYEMTDYAPGLIFAGSYLEIQDGRKIVMTPIFADGDGTVPMWSLETDAVTAKYYVPHAEGDSSGHGDVPKNKRVMAIFKQILQGKPPDPALYPYNGPASLTELEGGKISLVMGLGYSVDYNLHSDAHLSITNAAGEMLGFNSEGSIEETLSGTFYYDGQVEYASIANPSGAYRVTVNGIRDGEFTLDVTVHRDGAVTKIVYPQVPVKDGTVATFTTSLEGTQEPFPPMEVLTNQQASQVVPEISGDPLVTGPTVPTAVSSPAALPDATQAPAVTATVMPTATYIAPTSNPNPIPSAGTAASTEPAPLPTLAPSEPAPSLPPSQPPTLEPLPTDIPPPTVPDAPPGVYVTELETTNPKPTRNVDMGFVATFVNTTGAPQTYDWLVMIYQPGVRNAFGETAIERITVPVGVSEITSATNWTVRGAGDCFPVYARPFFRNADTSRTAFLQPDGSELRYDFSVCP